MNVLYVLLFSAISLISYGQAMVSAKISYQVVMTPRQLPLVTEGMLYINGNKSLFTSNIGKYPGKTVYDDKGISDIVSLDPKGNQVEKLFRDGMLNLRELVMSDVFVSSEKMPKFNWHILNETKNIGNYNCIKATLSFRGREYIAWYTLDIPISDGPWKFYGLPGLIMSIEDTQGLYKFTCQKVEIPYRLKKSENIKFSKKGKIVSIEDFRKAYYTVFEHWANISRAESEGVEDLEIKMNEYNPIELQYDDSN